MGEVSQIAWTDATFNPWWGCTRVSPGCEHCYAEQLATVRRKLPVWGVDAERKPMSEAYWREPLKWNRRAAAEGKRLRVFCASMADVFEMPPDRNIAAWVVLNEGRERLWRLIETTPHLDWLLLTKRPENVGRLAPWKASTLDGASPMWPSNVWLGTTCEDQARANVRIPILLNIPAAIRFVSYEPALGPIAFSPHQLGDVCTECSRHPTAHTATECAAGYLRHGIDWVIVGGESGSKARPFDLRWARDTVAACKAAGVACFVKQMGAKPYQSVSVETSGMGGVGLDLRDPKGGNPDEWPADLRVREFPR